jgi:hypothetical protein
MDDHIVIGVSDDPAGAVAKAGVPRQVQARPGLEDVSDAGELAHNLARLACARGVVHHQDFLRALAQPLQGPQAFPQLRGPVPRAND